MLYVLYILLRNLCDILLRYVNFLAFQRESHIFFSIIHNKAHFDSSPQHTLIHHHTSRSCIYTKVHLQAIKVNQWNHAGTVCMYVCVYVWFLLWMMYKYNYETVGIMGHSYQLIKLSKILYMKCQPYTLRVCWPLSFNSWDDWQLLEHTKKVTWSAIIS